VAAKLYIEVSEPIEALKAVIIGGNPQKVIKFAQYARTAEAYVLAANFLQSCDWHKDPKLIEKITLYYKKAKRYDSLANFYVSCAMLEIDEYKNYAKALKATEVAKKFASKGHNTSLIARLDDKIKYISQYIQAKEKLKTDPESALLELKELVADPAARDALRLGDVYATMFEYYASSQRNDEAWQIVEEMKRKSFQIMRYLDFQYVRDLIIALVGKSERSSRQDSAGQ
jgi:intraflagellar transport protein 140